MEIVLKKPESKLIVQNEVPSEKDGNDKMYFLAKGKCDVNINDKFNEKACTYNPKRLVVNDHFGEISMLYGCPRSATVVSLNYITCSSISRSKYVELTNIYPNLKNLFEKHVNSRYKDPLKYLLELKLNRLNFFKNLPQFVKNEFIYHMKVDIKTKGDMVYSQGDMCNKMHLV